MASHLIYAFEVIILPNEKVLALFHHFSLQFPHIAEISKKSDNIRTLMPPVPCISRILTTFNFYSGRARMDL